MNRLSQEKSILGRFCGAHWWWKNSLPGENTKNSSPFKYEPNCVTKNTCLHCTIACSAQALGQEVYCLAWSAQNVYWVAWSAQEVYWVAWSAQNVYWVAWSAQNVYWVAWNVQEVYWVDWSAQIFHARVLCWGPLVMVFVQSERQQEVWQTGRMTHTRCCCYFSFFIYIYIAIVEEWFACMARNCITWQRKVTSELGDQCPLLRCWLESGYSTWSD